MQVRTRLKEVAKSSVEVAWCIPPRPPHCYMGWGGVWVRQACRAACMDGIAHIVIILLCKHKTDESGQECETKYS